MPVIIENKDGNTVVTTTATKKLGVVKPTFFDHRLTGSNTATAKGYFTGTTHTFAQHQTVVGNTLDAAYTDYKLTHKNDVLPQYNDPSHRRTDDFRYWKTIPTTLLPKLQDVLSEIPSGVVIPIDTMLYGLQNVKTWSHEVINNQHVYIAPHITAADIFEKWNKILEKYEYEFEFENEILVFIHENDLDTITSVQLNTAKSPATTTSNGKVIAKLPSNANTGMLYACSPENIPFDSAIADHIQKQYPSESIYTELLRQSNQIKNHKMELLDTFFNEIVDKCTKSSRSDLVDHLLNNINWFDARDKLFLSVNDMSAIYKYLKNCQFSDITLEQKLNTNIRLLLESNISKLNADKPTLYRPQLTDQEQKDWDAIEQQWQQKTEYSNQQKEIILSKEPLVIAQAGAGSGKSHTVVGKLKYLTDQKQDLSKVLILSFTNAAADNILDRFPQIQSKTVARLIDDINHETFPHQELASIHTIANTLRLIDPSAPVFANIPRDNDNTRTYSQNEVETVLTEFRKIIDLFKTSQSSYKRIDLNSVIAQLMSCVRDHLNIIIAALNSIGQTSLELEPVIIHHMLARLHANLKIPKQYQDIHYIITDESQDISTFEYSLLLEFVHMNKSQFLIVGDGSQTLYEFRSSDPRYLNALEASGIFTTFKLDTNYRSKQAILSYANEFLKVIDANKLANIQLQANDKTPLTLDEFKERVRLRDVPLYRTSDVSETIRDAILYDDIQEYILDKLNKKEQICITAWTHTELNAIEKSLQQLLKDNNLNVEITRLAPKRDNVAPIWTTALAKANHSLRQLQPTANIDHEITNILIGNLLAAYSRASDAQRAYYESKLRQTLTSLFKLPQWQYAKHNAMTNHTMHGLISYLYRVFIQVEKKEIATVNFLQSNDRPDLSDAKIILSTIHSIKGFEFDNVIVAHNALRTKASSGTAQQEIFRMLFVALSRAKKTELIINMTADSKLINENTMLLYPMETAKYIVEHNLSPKTPQAQSANTTI